MNFELIEVIAKKLEHSSVRYCESEEAGKTIKMRFDIVDGSHKSGKQQVSQPNLDKPSNRNHAVKANAAGIVRFNHPCSTANGLRPRDEVAKGEIVFFLQVGDLLSAVTAPRAGMLGERLIPDGSLVGYGEEVMMIT